MREIPLWRGGQERKSLDSRPLTSVRGEVLAQVHLAPALLVEPTRAGLARSAPSWAEEPGERWRAIARAGELLGTAELDGLTPADHAALVTQATGAPLYWSAQALQELASGMAGVVEALRWQAPGGDLAAFSERRVALPDGRGYAWVPTGRVLGFIAPSNHPAVHLTWVLALAMGWSVLVRPGAEDPFTPARVLAALRSAGFPTERVALLAGEHDLVPAIVAACDRTIAYGGPALAALLGRDGRVLLNGPGHSKVLTDGPADIDFLLDCILHDGGRKCTCASAILVRGEAPGLLDGLAEQLRALPLLDPLDPAARVPVWRGGPPPAPALLVQADGLPFIQPDLVRVTTPMGLELPTPWATAAELPAGADPLPMLRGSLAVTLLSPDEGLRQACLAEPSIRKVMTGRIPPWRSEPGAPHQGLLSSFLYTAKYAPGGVSR